MPSHLESLADQLIGNIQAFINGVVAVNPVRSKAL
jgi:hypothetical protein